MVPEPLYPPQVAGDNGKLVAENYRVNFFRNLSV